MKRHARNSNQPKTRADRPLTDRIRASLVTLRAQSRVVTIVTLLGISAYFLSVLAAIPTTVALLRVLPDTLSSTSSQLLVATLALDLPKLVVLAAMAYPIGRLLAVRPWSAALGTIVGLYLMDGAVSWVMGSLDAVWLNRYAAPSRLGLLAVTYLITWWLAHLGWKSKQKRSGPTSRSETLQDAGHSADSTQARQNEQGPGKPTEEATPPNVPVTDEENDPGEPSET